MRATFFIPNSLNAKVSLYQWVLVVQIHSEGKAR